MVRRILFLRQYKLGKLNLSSKAFQDGRTLEKGTKTAKFAPGLLPCAWLWEKSLLCLFSKLDMWKKPNY